MSAFEVDPTGLLTPAGDCSRASLGLQGAARALHAGPAPDPGTPEGQGQVVAVLQQLSAATHQLGRLADDDAAVLVAASARYAAVDRSIASGVVTCA